mgnify:CR=1 FL=1
MNKKILFYRELKSNLYSIEHKLSQYPNDKILLKKRSKLKKRIQKLKNFIDKKNVESYIQKNLNIGTTIKFKEKSYGSVNYINHCYEVLDIKRTKVNFLINNQEEKMLSIHSVCEVLAMEHCKDSNGHILRFNINEYTEKFKNKLFVLEARENLINGLIDG